MLFLPKNQSILVQNEHLIANLIEIGQMKLYYGIKFIKEGLLLFLL